LIRRKKLYYYNDHTLAFEEIHKSGRRRVINFISVSLLAIVISGIAGTMLYHFAYAPEKYALTKKITFLESEMNRLAMACDSVGLILAEHYFPRDNMYRIILGVDTMPLTMRTAGSGGSAQAKAFLPERSLSRSVKTKIHQLDGQLNIQLNSFETLVETALEKEKKHTTIPAIQPIARENMMLISSFFGKRSDPFCHEEADHYGLDFVAAPGTKIYATGDGTVTLLKYSRTGYGNELVINHSFGYSTRYGHLEKFFVAEGELVKRGEVIGLVGNSGRSTGPHLHYEVLYEGKPVNPVFYYSDDLTDDEFHLLTEKTN